MAVKFIDRDGTRQELNLGVELYKEAGDKKLTFRQLVNQKYPNAMDTPETFKQVCASAGIRFKKDEETGQPASTLREILDPISYDAANSTGGTYTSSPMVPDSRILFPAAVQEAIESKLQGKYGEATTAFESLIGMTETVASNRLEQPVIKYDGAGGPENSAYQRVAQNTRPPIMLSLTAADISRTIPRSAIGVEISDDAMNTSLDFLSLTLARFAMMADYNEYVGALGLLLSGDPDAANTPMATAQSALPIVKANTLDATIVANGVLTHLAYMKWLHTNTLTSNKTNLIMDFATAMALDSRGGRPTNVQENSMDRMDVPVRMTFPTFNKGVIDALVLPVGVAIPANTIWAIDKEYAIFKTISSTLSYSAAEAVVMKRTQEFRMDRGWIIGRWFDSAHSVLSLTI
jgi:hypothetical protein